MEQWKQILTNAHFPPTQCDVPNCPNAAYIMFLPGYESGGGWIGHSGVFPPGLNISEICYDHWQPELAYELCGDMRQAEDLDENLLCQCCVERKEEEDPTRYYNEDPYTHDQDK